MLYNIIQRNKFGTVFGCSTAAFFVPTFGKSCVIDMLVWWITHLMELVLLVTIQYRILSFVWGVLYPCR